MNEEARLEAERFLNEETQFHLGMLPTEQSNPKTKGLDRIFKSDTSEGVAALLAVDRDVAAMAKRVLAGAEFQRLVEKGIETIATGGRIVFSGCGATGRLSILLEAMWRKFFIQLAEDDPDVHGLVADLEVRAFSIMTGGDYALIRSVECFEDHAAFGKRQVADLRVTAKDMLVAITEGGETSSVLGTVEEAADRGAAVFLLFNNPADVLRTHIERSRRAIDDPRVTVLDLFCGPMAIAGSTRMQATTSEQLVAGAALEIILFRSLEATLSSEQFQRLNLPLPDHATAFERLLDEITLERNVAEIARLVEKEADVYRQGGMITYFADDYLLDIFTDTTERAPTFMLPPFKRRDDDASPPSWAFVKHPSLSTPKTWRHVLGRDPRCLTWTADDYRAMNAPENVVADPPKLTRADIEMFPIGAEDDPARISRPVSLAMVIVGGSEVGSESFQRFITAFDARATRFSERAALIIGAGEGSAADYRVDCEPADSPLRLMERLAVKLTLNTLSTGTMVLMGRVASNWMSWVEVSNKKLRDRGIRLIAELRDVDYRTACLTLHETLEELRTTDFTGKERPSPVQHAMEKL